MSSQEPANEVDRADVRSVQTRVAEANDKTSNAVVQASPMSGKTCPTYDLQRTLRELQRAYSTTLAAISRVESTLAGLDGTTPTPRQITDDHADRLEEQYDGPVLNLALQLLERNRREWLYRKPDTNGAESVERHGLTENQRRWLNDLQDAWRDHDE